MREVFGALALSFRMMEMPADEGENAACSGDGSSLEHPLGADGAAPELAPSPAAAEIGNTATV